MGDNLFCSVGNWVAGFAGYTLTACKSDPKEVVSKQADAPKMACHDGDTFYPEGSTGTIFELLAQPCKFRGSPTPIIFRGNDAKTLVQSIASRLDGQDICSVSIHEYLPETRGAFCFDPVSHGTYRPFDRDTFDYKLFQLFTFGRSLHASGSETWSE